MCHSWVTWDKCGMAIHQWESKHQWAFINPYWWNDGHPPRRRFAQVLTMTHVIERSKQTIMWVCTHMCMQLYMYMYVYIQYIQLVFLGWTCVCVCVGNVSIELGHFRIVFSTKTHFFHGSASFLKQKKAMGLISWPRMLRHTKSHSWCWNIPMFFVMKYPPCLKIFERDFISWYPPIFTQYIPHVFSKNRLA